MFKDLIVEQNPHWDGELYEQGIDRNYFAKLLEYMTSGMIVSLLGARRAGKSTLLKQLINHLIIKNKTPPKNILFLNLEHPYFSYYSGAADALQKIYEEYMEIANPEGKVYVFFDEVQFFSQWPIFVKSRYEIKKIQFVLTGSNSSLLSSEFITLLSGRTLTLEVFPLSFQEFARASKIPISDAIKITKSRLKLLRLMNQFLKYGAFPEVALNPSSMSYDILNAYAKTILYQDVAPRLQVRKSVELERLFVYLISNIGKPFSYANLAEYFDLTDKIIKEYISAFSESYLLFELEVFDFSLKKQMRYPKKIYSIDTGQINAVAFSFAENLGRLLENLVFLELRRLGLEMYYYKTQNNLEIDFVAKKHLKMALIQVVWDRKNSDTFERETISLLRGLDELKLKRGVIITRDYEESLTENKKNILFVPAYKFFCMNSESIIELLF